MKYGLIVGSESGLAKSVINELTDYTLFCCDIAYKESFVLANRHYIPLDVTSIDSLNNVYKYVANITSKLDLISNFAGIVLLGSMVELPPDTLDKIINVNLLATYKINNIFFPLVENGGGRIINISSEYGVIGALPFHGYYAITKHAVEVYNDSLRRELAASNVKVVCIRPGAFKTNMQSGISNQFDRMVEETHRYKEPLTKMQFIMNNELVKAKDPKYFVRIYLKALNSKKPKRYYSVNNSFKMKLYTILPEGLKDLFFKIFLK